MISSPLGIRWCHKSMPLVGPASKGGKIGANLRVETP